MADNYDELRSTIDDVLASIGQGTDGERTTPRALDGLYGIIPENPIPTTPLDRGNNIPSADGPELTPEQIARANAMSQQLSDNLARYGEQPINDNRDGLAGLARYGEQPIGRPVQSNQDRLIDIMRSAAQEPVVLTPEQIEARDATLQNFRNSYPRNSEQPTSGQDTADGYAAFLQSARADHVALAPRFNVPNSVQSTAPDILTIPPELLSPYAIDIATPILGLDAEIPCATPLEPVRSFEDRLMSALDVNADGAIDIYDRLDTLSGPNNKALSGEVLTDMVNVLDTDNDGRISQNEISTAADTLGVEDRALVNILSAQMQRAGLSVDATGEGYSHTVGDLQVAMVNFTPQQDGAEVGRA